MPGCLAPAPLRRPANNDKEKIDVCPLPVRVTFTAQRGPALTAEQLYDRASQAGAGVTELPFPILPTDTRHGNGTVRFSLPRTVDAIERCKAGELETLLSTPPPAGSADRPVFERESISAPSGFGEGSPLAQLSSLRRNVRTSPLLTCAAVLVFGEPRKWTDDDGSTVTEDHSVTVVSHLTSGVVVPDDVRKIKDQLGGQKPKYAVYAHPEHDRGYDENAEKLQKLLGDDVNVVNAGFARNSGLTHIGVNLPTGTVGF